MEIRLKGQFGIKRTKTNDREGKGVACPIPLTLVCEPSANVIVDKVLE